MSAHYTAVVEISKTTPAQPAPTGPGRGLAVPTERRVDEVARIIIRASSVAELREKVAAHVALVEEVA